MAKRGSSRENAGEGIGWEVTIMNKESIQLEKELIDLSLVRNLGPIIVRKG